MRQRIRVIPKELNEDAIKRYSAGRSPLVLPSNDVFGLPRSVSGLGPAE
jgi:hypothetical protein